MNWVKQVRFFVLNGKEWKKRRQISQQILFRMCTSSFVNNTLDESMKNVVFPELNKLVKSKQLWYPSSLMKYCAFNVLFYCNFGCPISYNNTLYHQFIKIINEAFPLLVEGSVYSILPKFILFFFKLYHTYHYRFNDFVKRKTVIYQKFVKMGQENNENKNKDKTYYIDYIQNELSALEAESDTFSLFAAGTDPSSSTLNFAIVLCAKFPQIQEKVRNELIECYGQNMICNSDKDGMKTFDINWVNKLVYFRAFIYEVFRVSSAATVVIPHTSKEDIQVTMKDNQKCIIPKGSLITVDVTYIQKGTDKEYWLDSSNNMCLENWIDPTTNKFVMNKSFVNFGHGSRICVCYLILKLFY